MTKMPDKTSNDKSLSYHQLLEKLATLPDTYKKLLQLFSIVYKPTIRSNLMTLAQVCGLKDKNGKGFTNTTFKIILDHLVEEGFIETILNTYRCWEIIIEDLTWSTAQENLLTGWVKRIRECKIDSIYYLHFKDPEKYQHYIGFTRCLGEIRIGLYGNNPDRVIQFMDTIKSVYPKEYRSFNIWEHLFNAPFNAQRFLAVPLTLQALIVQPELTPRCILKLAPYHELIDQLKKFGPIEPSLQPLPVHVSFFHHYYITLLLCAGQFTEAETQMVLQPTDALSYFLQAWLDFLLGKNDTAIETYQQGLKLYQKAARKRDNYYPHVSNLFYILMLIKAKKPDHLTIMDGIITKAPTRDCQYLAAYMAFKAYIKIQKNAMNEAEQILATYWEGQLNGISLLMVALVTTWYFPKKLEKLEAQLKEYYQRARENQYLWFEQQYANLLACINPSFPQSTAEPLSQRLVDLVQVEPPWERTLNAVAGFLSIAQMPQLEEKSSRLAWFILITPYYITITPKQQTRNTRGSWSTGRALAFHRLLDDRFSCMTPQDRKVAAHISTRVPGIFNQRDNFHLDAIPAILSLVGHPYVFFEEAPTTPVEIVKQELELIVMPEKDGFRISFSIEDFRQVHTVFKESPTRLKVLEISEKQKKLVELIGPKGLKIPAKGKTQLQNTLKALSSVVTVQSGLQGQENDIQTVPAETRITIRFQPMGESMKIELLVCPFPGGNRYYKPGSGGTHVIAQINGSSQQTQRDLKQEIANYQEILNQSPTLALHDDGSVIWVLDQTEEILQILLDLETIRDRIVMEWPEGETIKLHKSVSAQQMQIKVTQSEDWFSLSGELQLNPELVLSLQQVLALLKPSASRFIPLGDGQYFALTEAFRHQLKELASMTRLSATEIKLHPLASLSMEDAWDQLQVEGDHHWQQWRARIRQSQEYVPQLPSTLQVELREYQELGFKWLSRLAYLGFGACLADDMGLGKTVQALALILHRAAAGPTLVVAPKSVSFNWLNEANRFTPTLNPFLFGGKDRNTQLDKLGPFDVLVCSYGLLHQETELLSAIHWTTIVLDEAQAIKNNAALRTKAAMSLQGDFRMITTGTPIENHLGELWTLIHFTNPGLLGSLRYFNDVFAGPIQKDHSEEARKTLKRLLQPFILRRLKSEVLEELPEKTEIVLSVEQDEQEAAFYEALRLEALQNIEQSGEAAVQTRFRVLAEIMRLRRACCHPRLVVPDIPLGSSKLTLLGQLVEELLENRHKALIFSQFVDHLAIIRQYLDEKGIVYQYLDGSTSLKDREKSVNAFQAGEGELFLISLKAGGFGLNLTAANYVIHMDPWWNPAVEDQASDRVHRIGQHRPVTIYRLVTSNTIEEKIVKLHKTKRDLADSLLAGTDGSAVLSVSQLIELMQIK